MEYRHLITYPKYKHTWSHSYGNKIGWLVQGMPGRVEGTNTFFSSTKQMPPKTGREMSHMDAFYVTTEKEKQTKQNKTYHG